MVRTGILPKSLKISRVIPIKKPKKPSDELNSFRPINNMNGIEKVLEHIIKTQLTKFLDDNKIIHENMHGSRVHHSPTTAKLHLDELINKPKDDGDKIALVNTDLTAAYDTVSHPLLLAKLEPMGIRGNALARLTNYLTNRWFYMEVQGYRSKLRKCQTTA